MVQFSHLLTNRVKKRKGRTSVQVKKEERVERESLFRPLGSLLERTARPRRTTSGEKGTGERLKKLVISKE